MVDEKYYYIASIEGTTYNVVEVSKEDADQLRKLKRKIDAGHAQLHKEFPGRAPWFMPSTRTQYNQRYEKLIGSAYDDIANILANNEKARATFIAPGYLFLLSSVVSSKDLERNEIKIVKIMPDVQKPQRLVH